MQRRIEEVLAVGQFAPLRDRLDDNAINDIIAVELAL